MANAIDILTLDEGKSAVGVNILDTEEDLILARYITAVSRLLDQRVGATVARSCTAETYNGGGYYIRLRQRPVLSITSLVEYSATTPFTLTAASVTSQPSLGYLAEAYPPDPTLKSGKVWRRSGNAIVSFAPGQLNVLATYSAGRYASTTQVDDRFKHAASICLENLWRDREQSVTQFGEFDVPAASFPTFALPRGASDLLADEVYWQRPLRAG
jgi:hypothetical protein